ncbi:MAG TPA: hypothetical protein PK339_12515 [Flavitalea sp.]|nr:hypothetical protein [Flavitalea sp.]
MDPLFTCPAPTALADIPAQACPERYDQIIRMFLMRRQSAALFTTTTVKVLETWTPLFAEDDSTKIIKTPLLSNVVIPPGEILKEGGNDNTTINGIPRLNGRGFAPVTIQLQDAESAVRKGLRALASESALQPGFTNLEAIFVNRFGQLIYRKATDNVFGIPIYNFVVGDVGTEGFGKSNIANMSFDLAPGWSDDVAMIGVTDFNPLTV